MVNSLFTVPLTTQLLEVLEANRDSLSPERMSLDLQCRALLQDVAQLQFALTMSRFLLSRDTSKTAAPEDEANSHVEDTGLSAQRTSTVTAQAALHVTADTPGYLQHLVWVPQLCMGVDLALLVRKTSPVVRLHVYKRALLPP